MAITVDEAATSRSKSGKSIQLDYIVRGTSDDSAVETAVMATAPAMHGGKYRESEPSLRCTWVDEITDTGEWEASVRYNPPTMIEPEVSVDGTFLLSGSTGGGTEHAIVSKQTIANYGLAGDSGPNYNKLIGVTDNGVEGADIFAADFRFTARLYRGPGNYPDLGDLYALSPSYNNAPVTFEDSKTGQQLTFALGECLFIYAEWDEPRADGIVVFTYHFAGSPNITNEVLGQVTVTEKMGWNLLWVRYQNIEDTSKKTIIKRPVSAHVERVYDPGDWSKLKIPVPA
ncbi:MAG: hypothetical protein JXM70_14050 [Pirellulales bacterium]|nr:hypothetical protein [Pirellulales bacterium]